MNINQQINNTNNIQEIRCSSRFHGQDLFQLISSHLPSLGLQNTKSNPPPPRVQARPWIPLADILLRTFGNGPSQITYHALPLLNLLTLIQHYLVPGTMYQVPGTWYQVPGTRYQVARYQVPGNISQVAGTRYHVPNAMYQAPGTMYQVPSTRYHVRCTRYHVPGTMYWVYKSSVEWDLNLRICVHPGPRIWNTDSRLHT
jgi:hypothetical protein